MTIRRQYSLPNCTLILEGMSDSAPVSGSVDARPLMTILVNAECHFNGQLPVVSGGRDFFESLVRSVSRYAQAFLSQVPHPKPKDETPDVVELEPIAEKNLHRMRVLLSAESVPAIAGGGGGTGAPSHPVAERDKLMELDLTTVQLFDLVEAIDQFLADQRTLPELKLSLQPVSRRYRKADQPLTQRAAPAAIGTAGLALAAIAFFLVPVPEVRQPRPTETEETSTQQNDETPAPSPNAATSPDEEEPEQAEVTPPSAEELEEALATTPEITDPTELGYLERNLYRQLNQSWENRGALEDDLAYQVSVGKDGAIIGYEAIDDTPEGADDRTPLPELLYLPATGGVANVEELALFRVVFTDTGVLQISPWRGRTGQAGLGPEITDPDRLQDLEGELREQILDNWGETATYPRELVYRVGVTEEGTIADYVPQNQPAWDYIQETPLEELAEPEAAGIGEEEGLVPQEPLAQFRVVFTEDGVLQTSPWRGY